MKKVLEMTSLERRVFGENLINELTIKNLELVLPQVQNFVGKKICLSNGSFSNKFNIEKLSVPYNPETGSSFRTYLRFSSGGTGLYLFQDVTVKDREYESGGYGASYYKKEVWIGDIVGGVLKEVTPLNQIISNARLDVVHDYKKVQETKDKIAALEEQIRHLKHSISNFI